MAPAPLEYSSLSFLAPLPPLLARASSTASHARPLLALTATSVHNHSSSSDDMALQWEKLQQHTMVMTPHGSRTPPSVYSGAEQLELTGPGLQFEQGLVASCSPDHSGGDNSEDDDSQLVTNTSAFAFEVGGALLLCSPTTSGLLVPGAEEADVEEVMQPAPLSPADTCSCGEDWVVRTCATTATTVDAAAPTAPTAPAIATAHTATTATAAATTAHTTTTVTSDDADPKPSTMLTTRTTGAPADSGDAGLLTVDEATDAAGTCSSHVSPAAPAAMSVVHHLHRTCVVRRPRVLGDSRLWTSPARTAGSQAQAAHLEAALAPLYVPAPVAAPVRAAAGRGAAVLVRPATVHRGTKRAAPSVPAAQAAPAAAGATTECYKQQQQQHKPAAAPTAWQASAAALVASGVPPRPTKRTCSKHTS